MSTVSDSADEFVKIMLDGTEVVLKLSGNLAKEMAILLFAMAKEAKRKNKGQTRLGNMLKSSSNLRIFSIKKEDFQDFKKQAKRYGVLYSALYKKGDKNPDGIIDILVKEEDSVRVNRITERFKLTTVTNIEKEVAEIESKDIPILDNKKEVDKDIQERNTSQELINKLLKKQDTEEQEENTPSNISRTEKEIQSENILKTNEKREIIEQEEKPSIKEKINTIRKENEEKEKIKLKEETKENIKNKNVNEIKHKHFKKKNRKKERSK